jgi:toxoflavin biosynthesis protein ToxC
LIGRTGSPVPSHLLFGTVGAGYRTYDYTRDEWQVGDMAPANDVHAMCVRGNDIITVGDSGIVRCNGTYLADAGSLCNFLVPGKYCVITGGQDGTIIDATSGHILYVHSAPLHCGISVNINRAEHLIVGSHSGEALVFRWDGRSFVHVRNVQLHTDVITGLACSGNVVFSTCADRTVAWHSLTGWRELRRTTPAHEQVINGCAPLDDGKFASAGRDLTLRIWNQTYDCVTICPPIKRSIGCVTACPQGEIIAIGSYDGYVARYHATTHQLLSLERPTTAGISAIAFSTDRDTFLASSYDGQIYPIPAAA